MHFGLKTCIVSAHLCVVLGHHHGDVMTQKPSGLILSSRFISLIALSGALALLIAVYWPVLCELGERWASDADYSHGFLVPGFAVLLLWSRRSRLPEWSAQPKGWGWGLVLLALGAAIRLGGEFIYYDWFSAVSLLLCVAGVFLALGGWPVWRWAWPAIAFLVFMIPLPGRLQNTLAVPLQRIATVLSTYSLQTLGLPALAEGNVIVLNDTKIGVVEACSGLRMLVVFTAVSTSVALLIRRPRWERVLVLFSAIPTALICNIVRITATGVLHQTAGSAAADVFFHDLAGWFMMPLAIGILWGELLLVSFLLEPAPADHGSPALRVQQLDTG